ncbi:large neutral amino acids transporter small subunit 1-like [Liolophura sinensis]|uniref:large neutral amino acids transporter small subunit 1-like n=1 Tax=Liolophura sinensis TaxID=3198878 RepID=UPI003159477E
MGFCKKGDKGSAQITKKVELKKQITLLQGVAIIIGIIIGSGIFVSPVGILFHVRSVGMSMVMWVICGIYNTLCALCYAELGASIPQSGGEYMYIKKAFGDFPAFICLWINFLLICPVGIAAACLIFSTYLIKPIFPDCDPPQPAVRLIAAVIICFLIAINMRNVKWAAKMQVVITASKLIALALIIVIGLLYIGRGEIDNFQNSFDDSDYSVGALAISFYSGFWAYSGWSYLNFLTEELINPNRNLPLAIIISMSVVITVYLIANVAYLGVLTPIEMLASPAVAVTFAEKTLGVMTWAMPILIALSVCGMINGTALSMSRLFWVGAREGHFPAPMSMINMKQLTPMPSLLVILILSLLMQSSNDIFYLIEMEGFGFASVLTIVLAGQAWLRYKQPNLKRPIKLPIVLPILLSLVSLFIVVLTVYQKPHESGLAIGLVGIGVIVYVVGCRWKNKPKAIQGKIDWVTNVIQKLLLVVPQDDPDAVNWD